jgi:glycosyltransferase involved in cell wall biosynthesis
VTFLEAYLSIFDFMNQTSPYRASILPLADQAKQPLWSVMIPTYNCADFLRKTLESVLAQNFAPDVMQIEVVDDCSTKDDPSAVVQELGQGRIGFYRQPQNLGHVGNFNTCLQRARGQFIHLLHGDDYVLYGFYKKMQHAFEQKPEIGAAFCRHIYVNEQGHWESISPLIQAESGTLNNWLERIIVQQYIQTPSIVVRRSVYEKLGGFDQRFQYYYEDWEMWVRLATQYAVWYEPEPLAAYRMRSASNSGFTIQTGENIREVRKGLDIVQSYLSEYLPEATIEQLVKRNLEYSAVSALETARRLLQVGNIEAGMAQIQEALKCSLSPKVFAHLGHTLFIAGVRRFIPQSA